MTHENEMGFAMILDGFLKHKKEYSFLLENEKFSPYITFILIYIQSSTVLFSSISISIRYNDNLNLMSANRLL